VKEILAATKQKKVKESIKNEEKRDGNTTQNLVATECCTVRQATMHHVHQAMTPDLLQPVRLARCDGLIDKAANLLIVWLYSQLLLQLGTKHSFAK